MERKITRLVLDFPHGATLADIAFICNKVQSVVKANVSEGGYMPTNKYGLNVDNVTFSEDTMLYTFGYVRSNHDRQ